MTYLALAIDDDDASRLIYRQVLRAANVDVIEAADGIEALESLQEQKPHLILLDMYLPRLHGWDLLAQIRQDEQYKDIPVIIISAHDRFNDLPLTMHDHVLVKPVPPRKLYDVIMNVLGSLPSHH